MNKRIIIFGNGIEAHFNKKLGNFNEAIKQWIMELNKDSNKISDLFEVLSHQILKTSSDDKNEDFEFVFWKTISDLDFLRKILRLLKNKMIKNPDASIEDIFKVVGYQAIEKEKKNSENADLIKEIVFDLLKILLGYFIEFILENKSEVEKIKLKMESLTIEEWEILGVIDEFNFDCFYTTNYSDFVPFLISEWNQNTGIFNYFTENIHGKFSSTESSFLKRYSNLQINLSDKNHDALKKEFEKDTEIDNYTFEFYGLNLKNDEKIITDFIKFIFKYSHSKVFSSKFNINIRYNFYNFSDKEETLDKIVEAVWKAEPDKNYRFESYKLDIENDEKSILTIKIYDAEIHYSFKLLINIDFNDVHKHEIYKFLEFVVSKNLMKLREQEIKISHGNKIE